MKSSTLDLHKEWNILQLQVPPKSLAKPEIDYENFVPHCCKLSLRETLASPFLRQSTDALCHTCALQDIHQARLRDRNDF